MNRVERLRAFAAVAGGLGDEENKGDIQDYF
jgi:hypothetical protein